MPNTSSDAFALGGALFVLAWLALCVVGALLLILWTALPFAVFGIKRRLNEMNFHLRRITELLEGAGHGAAAERRRPDPATSEPSSEEDPNWSGFTVKR